MLPLALLSPTGLFVVRDFGWDVRAGFVFDVDDARFLLALQYHFLMSGGQHVVRVLFLRNSCFCKVQLFQRMLSSIRHNDLEW